MLLVIDIGNTHTVLGLYRSAKLVCSWRLESDGKRTVDEYALQIFALFAHEGADPAQVKQVCISCVVPALSRTFAKLASKYFKAEALFVGSEVNVGIEIAVDEPKSVGADRIVNAVACRDIYGCPAVVVDFGTATTFDVIDQQGRYVGGIIAPGVLISAEALFSKAALLPSVEFAKPEKVIGKNTKASMLSGAFLGYVCMVDGLIEKIQQELGSKLTIIGTGGLARLMADESKYLETVVPELTLEGLRIIAGKNKRK